MELPWESLANYEGLYNINRSGEVFSVRVQRIMLHQTNECGYLYLMLKDSSKTQHKCFIHRLLAIQYLPNPDNLPLVDHIDRDITNNSLTNLRWVTTFGNMRNRKDSLHLKTQEEMDDHVEKKREYKKIKAREYAAKKKENPIEETPEAREERLAKHRDYCKKSNDRKKNPDDPKYLVTKKPTALEETMEEREERLAKSREYNRKYLAKKKAAVAEIDV
jgi:hypothetical protein